LFKRGNTAGKRAGGAREGMEKVVWVVRVKERRGVEGRLETGAPGWRRIWLQGKKMGGQRRWICHSKAGRLLGCGRDDRCSSYLKGFKKGSLELWEKQKKH